VHLTLPSLWDRTYFRDAGESVLPDFAEVDRMKLRDVAANERVKHPDSGKGERVDLKGEREPFYTPVFLRLRQGESCVEGTREAGHNSY
jgi:hypothetical protein